ncbi:DUF7146 domain-containing protein [Motilimonas eburnea]|uniref:DUF7146 domain-containing protein n=1 Tax=Motilimonas eburnea TaxID=1737488 RepID=UPI001E5FB759|nr:toprim domain-containing protein [Motilimonas eburnea]MCE2571697.1 toprim domain-containing protein [Motilimonas eburnea]
MDSKIDRVKALVLQRGGWEAVYKTYPAIMKSANKNGAAVPDPRNGEGKTRFRLYKDWRETGGGYLNGVGALPDGIEVIAEVENISKGEAMNLIIQILGGDLSSVTRSDVKRVQDAQQSAREHYIEPEKVAKRKANVEKVFSGCVPIQSSAVALTYLQNRGLNVDNLPRSMMFNPSVRHWDPETGKNSWWPAIVSVITDVNGRNVSLHIIYLEKDGSDKAPVCRAKQQMPAPEYMGGKFIRLAEPVWTPNGYLIATCEGIETGLAIMEATGIPVWAGISADIMALMEFPPEVTNVLIYEDKDRSEGGQRCAKQLETRLLKEGRSVEILTPSSPIPAGAKSVDWLDEFIWNGVDAFEFYIDEDDLAQWQALYEQQHATQTQVETA